MNRINPTSLLLLLLMLLPGGGGSALAAQASLPHGVAAGDATPQSAVLWTRTLIPGEVQFQWGTNASLSPVLGTATMVASDTNVPVKVKAENLNPGTWYSYEVTDASGSKATGQFRTPSLPGIRSGLRFGISGDWRGELAPYPALVNAADRGLDFFVALGDTIYGDYPSPALTNESARTLAEYRIKHAEVYSTRLGLNSLANLRASTVTYAQIDDHEVVNDFAGGAVRTSDDRFDGPGSLINDSPRYRDAIQAFVEYNPIEVQTYSGTGEARLDGKPKLYRARTFGSDASVFLLDARSFRDQGLPSVGNPSSASQVGAYLARSFDINPLSGQPLPRRTMLSRAQLEELKRDLLIAQDSGVLWKFICVPEPIQNLGVLGASDRFEGYAAERTELLKFIEDNQVRNVVFVSADIHGTLVNNLTYQVGPGQPQIQTGAFEITTGSVAFDAPFGPTILDLAADLDGPGGLSLLQAFLLQIGVPNRQAFDKLLPRPAKDAAMRSLIDSQLALFGYTPLGLEDSQISAHLLAGSYVGTFTFGWTEFEIDPVSSRLTVTTFGIDPYTANDITPLVAGRVPEIISRFTVDPRGPTLTVTREGGSVRVSWPANAGPFVLQSRRSLAADKVWTDIALVPEVLGAVRSVTLPLADTEFLRLVLR